MTPKQQNMAVAAALGLRPFLSCGEPVYADSGGNYNLVPVPDYGTDAEAMRKALDTLTDEQLVKSYAPHLQKLTKPDPLTPSFRRTWWAKFLRPTLTQQREAFLRTTGRWEQPPSIYDSKPHETPPLG